MARKEKSTPIHPRTLVSTLSEYLGDVNYMQSIMDNAHRFLTDPEIDKEKVAAVVAEQIKEAIDRMQKWRDAD